MALRNASLLCQWESEPSYSELVRDLVQFFKEASEVTVQTPIKWSEQFRAHEMIWFGIATSVFIVVSIWAKKYLFWRLIKDAELSMKKKRLFCDSLWYFVSTLIMWSFSFQYMVVETRFFQCPSKLWDDWSLQSEIAPRVFPAIMVCAGFYLQCTVSVIFLEEKRKDSTSAIIHHGITTLIFFLGSAFRYYHMSGLATLILNFTSLPMFLMHMLLLFKDQPGKYSRLRAQLTNFMLLLFTLTCLTNDAPSSAALWSKKFRTNGNVQTSQREVANKRVLFRLYWYPLRCLYAIGPVAMKKKLLGQLPYIWLTFLLFCLYYILNVYWFIMLLNTIYKFAKKSKGLKQAEENKFKEN